MRAKCANCGGEFAFLSGRISLVCQSCGCQDLTFNESLVLAPVTPNGELGQEVNYLEGEPFFGGNKFGSVWEVKIAPSTNITPKPEPEPVKEEQPKEEKPTLVRTSRRLRTKVGP